MKLPAILLALPFLSACAVAVVPVPLPGTLSTMDGPSSASSASQASLPATAFGAALNDFRARQGLGPVVADAELTAAAEAHAKDMVAGVYFSHKGRDGSDSGDRARRAGCSWRAAAENIAWGQTSEGQVLQGWADSSGHRRNMLGRSYTRYGLGRAGTTWVLMFADRC